MGYSKLKWVTHSFKKMYLIFYFQCIFEYSKQFKNCISSSMYGYFTWWFYSHIYTETLIFQAKHLNQLLEMIHYSKVFM